MPSDRSLSMCAHKPDSSLISLGILVVILTRGTIGQDIVYPDENKAEVSQQVRDITPKSPSSSDESRTAVPREKCDDNMILDEFSSTTPFCKCRQGYLYYPSLGKCYLPYRRGPCDEGEYLIERAYQRVVECIVNPCERDNMVLYEGSCHDMSSNGPCPAGTRFRISIITMKPACEMYNELHTIRVPLRPCAPGWRRMGRGRCRHILSSSSSSSTESSSYNEQ